MTQVLASFLHKPKYTERIRFYIVLAELFASESSDGVL